MRALLTCRPLAGHYRPMLPLARALAEAGHDVAFASGEPVAGEAEAEGFTAFRVGLASDSVEPLARRVRDRAASLPPSHVRPLVFTELFVRVELEPRANDLFEDRRAVGAARCRTRRRGVRRTARRNRGRHPVCGAQLRTCHTERRHPCRRATPLPPSGPRTASRRTPSAASTATCTSTCARPASRYPKRLRGAVQGIRTVETRPPETQLPWLDALRGLPIVYITLGTVYNRNLGVFRALLDGLRDEALNVVVTVGKQNDPAVLGLQPSNVHVHQYIPQELLLPHCAAVVTHGGAGSTLGALAFGLPLLIVPQGADHFYNAERVVAAGAGVQLMPDRLTADSARDAVRTLLHDDTFQDAAHRIKNELDAMPDPRAGRRDARATHRLRTRRKLTATRQRTGSASCGNPGRCAAVLAPWARAETPRARRAITRQDGNCA